MNTQCIYVSAFRDNTGIILNFMHKTFYDVIRILHEWKKKTNLFKILKNLHIKFLKYDEDLKSLTVSKNNKFTIDMNVRKKSRLK